MLIGPFVFVFSEHYSALLTNRLAKNSTSLLKIIRIFKLFVILVVGCTVSLKRDLPDSIPIIEMVKLSFFCSELEMVLINSTPVPQTREESLFILLLFPEKYILGAHKKFNLDK